MKSPRMTHLVAPALLAAGIFAFSGCGGGETTPPASSNQTSAPNETPAEEADSEEESEAAPETALAEDMTPAEETNTETTADPAPAEGSTDGVGNLVGTILLDGDAPALAPLIEKGAEGIKDQEVCSAEIVPDESVVIGENKGIANVFVYLRRAPKGYQAEPVTEPIVVDQQNCVFTPHVALIRTDQPVMVKSNDAVQHNLHTFPARNQPSNLLIKPNEREGVEISYSRAESEPISVKCDIHAWMASYHLILDHPFMAVTDSTGAFRIEGLPAGDYEFRVWHEKGGLLEKALKVTVNGGADAEANLTYSPAQITGG